MQTQIDVENFFPAAARCLAGAVLLCLGAIAHADQLIVTTVNSVGNAIYDLSLSPTSPPLPLKPVILTTGVDSDGSKHGSYDAVVWATNPYCKTLDLIVADSLKGQILRYAGASTVSGCYHPAQGATNGAASVNPTAHALFSWTKIGSGPALPTGLAADANGNVFVISSSGRSDPKASVWVLPFNSKANLYCSSVAAGGYCAPVLLDNRFSNPAPALLADTLVASTSTPLWNMGDLLVLISDSYDASLVVYSKKQLYGSDGLLAIHSLNLPGPTNTAIPYSKFHPLLAQPYGMDLWPATTPGSHASLLFTTLDGRILSFDTVENKFVSNFASGLGSGLQKLKVASYANVPYALVTQKGSNNTGQILAFGAPTGSSNKALATYSTGLRDPIGLAVVYYGSTPTPPSCSNCVDTVAPLGPVAVTTFTPPPGVSFPGTISEQSCIVQNDPRVTATLNGNTLTGWSCTGADLPIGAGTAYCPSFPAAVIPGSLCGHSGPTASGFAVIEGTALGLDPADNNTFFQTALNIDTVLPGPNNLECSNFRSTGQIPLTAWGTRSDLTTVEGSIAEDSQTGFPNLGGSPGYLADMTSYCDTSTTGGHGISIFAFGLGLSTTSPSYVYGLQNQQYEALQQTVTAAAITPTVQATLASDLTAAEAYVSTAESGVNVTGNLDCALAQIYSTDQYLRSKLSAFSSNLVTTGAGGGNPDPAGDIDSRLAAWYLRLNTEILGIQPPAPPPATGYPLPFPVPPSSVPSCAPAQYSVGGTVAGLNEGSLVLQDSNGDTVTVIYPSTTFNFPADLASGASFNVTVQTPPVGESCSVTNGSGAIVSASVTNILVSCNYTGAPVITDFYIAQPGGAVTWDTLNIAPSDPENTTSGCYLTDLYAYSLGYTAPVAPSGSDSIQYTTQTYPYVSVVPPDVYPGYGTDTYTLTCFGSNGTPVTQSILNSAGFTGTPELTITSFTAETDDSDLNTGFLDWTTNNYTQSTNCTLTDAYTFASYSPIQNLPANQAAFNYGPGGSGNYFPGPVCQFGSDVVTLTCSDPGGGSAIATVTLSLGPYGCGD